MKSWGKNIGGGTCNRGGMCECGWVKRGADTQLCAVAGETGKKT